MVYMLLGTGFEEVEAITPLDFLRRAGIDVLTVGIGSKTVFGSHGIEIAADITLDELDLTNMQALLLPGGLGGVQSIMESTQAMNAVAFAGENNLYIGAICAGPTILAKLGITDGKNVTCYPGCEAQMGNAIVHSQQAAVRDGYIITGASAGCALPYALTLIAALRGEEAAQAIGKQIVIR